MDYDVAVVSHGTAAHLLNLLLSIRDVLAPAPPGEVHLWENASGDQTPRLLERLAGELPWLRVHPSPANLGHGLALDVLLRERCRAEWVLLLDSDTEILGDVGALLPRGPGDPPAFAGQVHPDPPQLYLYLCHLFVNRSWYGRLPPFGSGGAPGLATFAAVERQGIPWVRRRFSDLVLHHGQATLRGLLERGERTNPLYRFAAEETRRAPWDPARRQKELELASRLHRYLGDSPPGPQEPARPLASAGPARRRGPSRRPKGWFPAPARWHLGRAVRLGLAREGNRYLELLRRVRRLAPRRLLEIGTARGGSLYLWTRGARRDALILSIDLPPWELDDPGERSRLELLRGLAGPSQRIVLLRSDSHEAETLSRALEALAGEPLDFLFLDGDPSVDGIRRDVASYASLVRPGGLVALEGVWSGSPRSDAVALWKELGRRYRTEELGAPPTGGTGLVLI